MHNTDVIHEMVSGIYAAMLGEIGWHGFLEQFSAICPDALTTLFYHDMRNGAGAVSLTAGAQGREQALIEYGQYYAGLNPWMKNVAATPIGTGIIGEQIVARRDFNRSQYYNDFLLKNGYETGVGVTLFKDENCYFLLSILTSDKDEDANMERAKAMTLLAPHLQRVFRYYRDNPFNDREFGLGQSIGEAAHIGLLIVNENLRVAKASPIAEVLLSEGAVAGMNPLGQIRFRSADVQALLQHILKRRHTETLTECISDGPFDLRMICIASTGAFDFFAGRKVAILVRDNRRKAAPDYGRIRLTYALTAAESRVLVEIVSGSKIDGVARTLNVGRETVRSHLKSIFAKTGTHNQADLVRLTMGIRQN